MISKFFYTLLLFSVSYTVFCQEKYTISGIIKSAQSGETIIGASISSDHNGEGVVSNAYGFYSITLPAGQHTITYSATGFNVTSEVLLVNGNLRQNIFLQETIKAMDEVVVATTRRGRMVSGTQMGVERLTMEEVKKIPMLLGERDILKAIQLLPGIKAAGDGNSGLYVRGGATDQNLILLDEALVYNPSHLFGFFSTFNPDVVKDLLVYKGGMPAQYGGRLSSVIDIKMNDGNNQQYGVSGGIGLIASKLNVEGPIKKGSSSFLLSGRRTYADVFTGLLKDSAIKNNKLYFYDFNAKINYALGKKDNLYLSGYFGRDFLKLEKQFGLDWGNATGVIRWNHIFNHRLFSNTSVVYSDFYYNIALNNTINDLNIFSKIRDLNLKQEFQWYAGQKHTIRFGLSSIYHQIKPGEVTSSGNSSYNNLNLQNRYSWDNALYFTDSWKASAALSFTYGVRVASFSIFGPGNFYQLNADGKVIDTLKYSRGQLVKNYINVEPRLAAGIIISPSSSIKVSYVRNSQNLHLIANSTSNAPTDKWVASTNIIKPELSDLYAIGWYKNIVNNTYELTLEAYYKTLQNQIDYRTGADVFRNDAIESLLLFGKGRAYGLEALIKKKYGRFTGWVSYTLAKTERKIEGINNGNWYPARQDRTHDLAILANYQLSKQWSLSANWIYYTGDAITFPAGKYAVDKQIVFYYTERNSRRMPDYHRLDISAAWQLKSKRLRSSELAFSLYNLYARQNPYIISFRQKEDDPLQTEAVQTSLFKLVPSISYNFKF